MDRKEKPSPNRTETTTVSPQSEGHSKRPWLQQMKFPGLKALGAWHMNHATSTEEAKVLIPKGPVPRITESLVHLALLAITPYVLFLNFRNTYWSDTGAPYVNTRLEAFQFAAKLYEILICASLASTALYLLRQALWSSGVSLGSLVASYGFGDVSILLSPAFWGGLVVAMQPHQQPRHFAFVIFLVLAIFIAAVAGPSAAIILIPQLKWWPQSYNATLLPYLPDLYYLNISTTSLWPPSLNTSHLPDVNCLAPTAVQNPLCPAGGYSELFEQTRTANGDFNISMPAGNEFPVQFSRNLIGQSWDILDYAPVAPTIASTPSQELAGSLWDVASNFPLSWENPLFTIMDLNGHGLLKPLVQVECQAYDTAGLEIESLPVQFPYNFLVTPPFPSLNGYDYYGNSTVPNIYQGQNWTVSISSIGNTTDLEDHMRNGSLYFAWVDLSQYDPKPSIAAAIFVPSCDSSVPVSIAACSVDARWLPTDMWISPTQSLFVFESYSAPLDLINSLAGEELEPRPIDIGIDWAKSLNLNLSESSTSMESLLNQGSASACEPNISSVPTSYFQANLALALADGLARVGCGANLSFLASGYIAGLYGTEEKDYYRPPAQDIAAVSNWTRLDIGLSRYGYGYGMSTVTKRFAAAVLLGQAAIALATVTALALSKRISSSWSSVGELVALAINSKPTPRLQNTGAGVSRLDTWKEKVMVRAADERLQIIFESDGRLNDYSKPDLGKKYA